MIKDDLFDYCEQMKLCLEKSRITSLDFILPDKKIGVMVRDWNRTIGYNVVILADRIRNMYDEISNVIIITNSFSYSAKRLAKQLKIPIILASDLIMKVRLS